MKTLKEIMMTTTTTQTVNRRRLIPFFIQGILAFMVFTLVAQAQTVATATTAQGAATDIGNSQSETEPSAAKLSSTAERAKTGKTHKAAASASKSIAPDATKSTVVSKPSPFLSFTAKAADASERESTGPQTAPASADAADLAKKLANPLASLISFPIQANFDFRMGTGSGWRSTINVQPVIPVALNKDWNLISRTIVPIIHQGNVTAPGASQNGLGDIVQNFFLSPNKSEPFIWGVGPVVLVPTATNQFLGGKQLGLGPTAVLLKQQKGWTVGVLWNHVWRVAGGSGRPKVNADFVQPFISYSTKDGWSYTLNTESTYDWTGNSWGVPVHFQVAKIVRFGKQPISFGGAMRCWVTSPSGGPEGCGLRIVVTGIFPKK